MKIPTSYTFMEKKRTYSIFAFIITILIFALLPSNPIKKAMSFSRYKILKNKVIVIDPGHGGIDGGTNFEGILEKNINLEIGLKLKEKLEKRGGTVIMTRETDDSLDNNVNSRNRHREDLNNRVKIINDSEADIFISIHVNYIKNPKKLGPIVFYHEESEEGKDLAEKIQTNLNKLSAYEKMDINIGYSSTPGNYFILFNSIPPGVIIETGFISNELDRKLLLDSDHQNEIAERISKSIIEFFYSQF
ncbi:MAG: hypothetical protein GX300_01795 [Tissierellia bacterium]|nr:hypothetical protein [Tissierellia bacterium]